MPVIDGTNLAKNIEHLREALADAERQIQQIEEMRTQIEELTNINGLLENVLGSISGLNDIADLYNSVEDIRSRAAKITDLSGFADSLAIGDFSGLLDSLLDGEVTMGERRAVEAVQENLARAGFDPETLAALSGSENRSDAVMVKALSVSIGFTTSSTSRPRSVRA